MEVASWGRFLACVVLLLLSACTQDRRHPGDRGGTVDGSLHDDNACGQDQVERDLVSAIIPVRLENLERYAGRRIVCDPLAIVVLLKGSGALGQRKLKTSRGEVVVTYEAGYRYSVREMEVIANGKFMEDRFPGARGIYTDAVYGRVIILVDDPSKIGSSRERARRIERELGFPIFIMPIGKAKTKANI